MDTKILKALAGTIGVLPVIVLLILCTLHYPILGLMLGIIIITLQIFIGMLILFDKDL
jgi:hypothetical protein